MQPITVRLVRIGDGTGHVVPATAAQLFDFEPGMEVRAIYRKGKREKIVQKALRGLWKSSVGIIIPGDVLDAFGWKAGMDVPVPFHEWKPAK